MQRFFCVRCGKSFRENQPLDGIRIDTAKAVQVVQMLAETMGVRGASRITGLDKDTILRILVSAGEHCARLLDAKIRNLTVPIVQADEVFSYVRQKPNGENDEDPERGDCWTYLSIAKYERSHYLPCGTHKFKPENIQSPLCAPDNQLLKESGQSPPCGCLVRGCVQLLPCSQVIGWENPCNGRTFD